MKKRFIEEQSICLLHTPWPVCPNCSIYCMSKVVCDISRFRPAKIYREGPFLAHRRPAYRVPPISVGRLNMPSVRRPQSENTSNADDSAHQMSRINQLIGSSIKRTKKMILAIDFESTCEKGRPKGYPSDIIEIGAVWATPEGEALDTLRLVVQTENPITAFCTELTGLSQSDVDGGLTYAQAMEKLAEFASRYSTRSTREWASWGVSDLHSLEIDCAKHGVENPLKDWTHRNLKKEFVKARRIKPQMGLAKALEIAGFEMDDRHHSALPDALNTIKFLPHIAAVIKMRDSLFYREQARRKALWNLQSPGQREKALKTLALIEHLDRRSPIGDGAKLTTADLRKSVRIVPASGTTIAHVVESEIPQPWRERFQQASVGSTKQSQDTAYAHDWFKFLESWDNENDYQK